MPDKTYAYSGPLSAVSLPADADHPDGRHVQLVPGALVTLPEDNAYVRTLAARGYLTVRPQPQSAPAQPPAPAAAPTTQAAPAAPSVAAPTAETKGV